MPVAMPSPSARSAHPSVSHGLTRVGIIHKDADARALAIKGGVLHQRLVRQHGAACLTCRHARHHVKCDSGLPALWANLLLHVAMELGERGSAQARVGR